MFEIGEYIIYGPQGVCKVVDVGSLDMPGIAGDRMYYTLEPCHTLGGKVFTPVDNEKAILRAVISKEEAAALLDELEDIELIGVPDERKREFAYRDAARKCECREWMKIIKTAYLRKRVRAAAGKKVTAGDEKYFHIAEENLCKELAVALGMDKGKVEEILMERVERLAAQRPAV